MKTKSHAGMKGIRICVYKPDATGWTTVYASAAYLADVFAICGEDVGAVTHQARYASLSCVQKEGEAWSQTVLAGARKLLIADEKKLAAKRKLANAAAVAKTDAEALARLAAENNAAWGD